MSNWRFLVPVSVVCILSVATGAFLDGYVGSLLIWGGSDCETVNGVLGCFGYPPSGIVVIAIVWAVLVSVGIQSWSRLRAYREEGDTI